MIDDSKVYRCECREKGLEHVFTTDASGKHILLVDPDRARLLRDASWSVSPIHRKSKVLRARSTTSAPGIKKGRQLHQLVKRTGPKRRLWAINRNYLDCRRANLRSLSYADSRILSTARPSTKAVGVSWAPQPPFFRSLLRPFHARIRVNGKDLSLSWWATLEEAQRAYDAAAIMVHGPTATTNQLLGLLSPEIAQTKACRIAAKTARRVIQEHRSGELAKRYEALKKTKTYREKLAVWAGIRAVGQPVPGPRVEGAGAVSSAA
jgi:hypothetical protein